MWFLPAEREKLHSVAGILLAASYKLGPTPTNLINKNIVHTKHLLRQKLSPQFVKVSSLHLERSVQGETNEVSWRCSRNKIFTPPTSRLNTFTKFATASQLCAIFLCLSLVMFFLYIFLHCLRFCDPSIFKHFKWRQARGEDWS